MTRKHPTRLLSAVLFLFALAACEAGPGPSNHPTAPQSFLSGGSYGGYDLADDPLLPTIFDQSLTVSGFIGLEGGSLQLLGHSITVPSGAVLQPTLFTMVAIPGGYTEVDLTAGVKGLFGRFLDVGEQGFRKPVRVTLTYERSRNIPDPTQLVLLRLNGPGGVPEALPTHVDLIRKTVSADLDHFSRYAIAFPH